MNITESTIKNKDIVSKDIEDKDIDDICLIKNLSINNEATIQPIIIVDDKDKNLHIRSSSSSSIFTGVSTKENTPSFDIKKYFEKLDIIICNILSRNENNTLTYDILDTEKTIDIKLISLKEKQRQMKIGEIWQEVLGNYDGFINLKIGHETGLDILSHTKKVAIELKNRTNTDNSSSRKANFDKLANFKKKNPEYTCIYANINSDTEEKTLKGMVKIIKHNNIEIEHQVGYIFLKFMLGNDVDIIIDFIKNTINKYINK